MAIISLKVLSLETILENLKLLAIQCLSNCILLPVQISNEIFEYIHSRGVILGGEEVVFFSSKVSSLTSIKLVEGQLINIQNYDFLKNHQIESVIYDFSDIKDFIFLIDPICLKSLWIKNGLKSENSIKSAVNFIKKCENLQSLNLNCYDDGILIKNLFMETKFSDYSLKTLCLHSQTTELYELYNDNLREMLENCQNLSEIQINYNVWKQIETICQGLQTSYSTLSSIDIEFNSFTNRQIIALANLLDNCRQLKVFRFNYQTNKNGENTTTKNDDILEIDRILNGLANSCENLQEISLIINDYTFKENDRNLINLLNNCRNLQTIQLSFKDVDIYSNLGKMAPFSKLNKVNVKCSNGEELKYVGDFLSVCHHIQTIVIDISFDVGRYLKGICNSLTNSCRTLTNINLSGLLMANEHMQHFADLVMNCNSLESIELTLAEIGKEAEMIWNSLTPSKNNLTNLKLCVAFSINTNDAKCLAQFLYCCRCLQKFELLCNNVRETAIIEILNGLLPSCQTLKYLKIPLPFDRDHGFHLVNFVSRCKILQELNILGNKQLLSQANKFTNAIRNSCRKITRMEFFLLESGLFSV
ncbi:unnamed protein product [Dimorphilus gyrociliatus]|uniref:Uncharacterized protein n=1 Tax=Dimorphilus gyrociliatus TaxID=2664684 RepID=A0A7I8VHI2_9ANNE|nr:unnamed protein product [Dimorphilus gyrociliatus]